LISCQFQRNPCLGSYVIAFLHFTDDIKTLK